MQFKITRDIVVNIGFAILINVLFWGMVLLLPLFEVDGITLEISMGVIIVLILIYGGLDRFYWSRKEDWDGSICFFVGTILGSLASGFLIIMCLNEYSSDTYDFLKKSLIIWGFLFLMHLINGNSKPIAKTLSFMLSVLYGTLVSIFVNLLYWETVKEGWIDKLYILFILVLQVSAYFLLVRKVSPKKRIISTMTMIFMIPLLSYSRMFELFSQETPGFFMAGAGYVASFGIHMILWGSIMVIELMVHLFKKILFVVKKKKAEK